MIGILFITKWRQSLHNLYLAEWASRYDKVVIILSLFSGFYPASDILTSHLFHLNSLSLQISERQKLKIWYLRVLNTVLLENVPCLVIQWLSLSSSDKALGDMNVTLLAMAFSGLAVLFGVLTITERLFNLCISKIRQNSLDNYHRINMEFSLISSESGVIHSYHMHSAALLTRAISFALYRFHVQSSQIQIINIESVSDGIAVRAKIKNLNDNQRCGIVDGLQDCRSEMYCKLQQECIKCLQIEMSCVITLDMSHIEVPTMPTRGEGQEMEMTETEAVRNTKKSMSGRASMSSHHHVAVMSDSEEIESPKSPVSVEDDDQSVKL